MSHRHLPGWRVGWPGPFVRGVVVGVLALSAVRSVVDRTPVADWMVGPLLIDDTPAAADVIVVAGAGVIGECEVNGTGVRRVLLGVRLWELGRAPTVLFTGGSAGGNCPVGVAMARLARQIGLPPSATRIETGSRSTRENAELSVSILRSLGVTRLLLVTDRLHMPRASGVFGRLGFSVERASVPIYAGHDDNWDMLGAAGREAAALLYYRSRGWLGPAPAAVSEHHHQMSATTSDSARGAIDHPLGPIVLLGASYAAGWPLAQLGDRPVRNLGVPGQQSFEMLDRFEREVVPLQPRAVILWGFINDIFRSVPRDQPTLERVRDSYRQMVALARRHGIEPILTTELTIREPRQPLGTIKRGLASLLGRQSYQDVVNQDVMTINGWLADFAGRERLLLLDLQSTLAGSGGRRRPEYAIDDGSHVSEEGYAALSVYSVSTLEAHLVNSAAAVARSSTTP